jgi:hypothetical protein
MKKENETGLERGGVAHLCAGELRSAAVQGRIAQRSRAGAIQMAWAEGQRQPHWEACSVWHTCSAGKR